MAEDHPTDSDHDRQEERRHKREYNQRYRSTPHGAAMCAWNRLTSRAGAKYNHRRCYANIEVRVTLQEFLAWAVPEYEAWFRERPGVTPSVDRIDSDGHYEVGNLRIIGANENRRRSRKFVNDLAPEGTKRCGSCKQFLPHDHFYQCGEYQKKYNPLGLSAYCKECTRQKHRSRYLRKKSQAQAAQDIMSPGESPTAERL